MLSKSMQMKEAAKAHLIAFIAIVGDLLRLNIRDQKKKSQRRYNSNIAGKYSTLAVAGCSYGIISNSNRYLTISIV